METILVIGSNSFSGSNFTNTALSNNKKVIGVSRSREYSDCFLSYKRNTNIKNFKFIQKNINSASDRDFIVNLIIKKKIKKIVNFSALGMVAESFNKPEDWYMTNTISQILFCEKLKNISLDKYLQISTPEVYGNTNKNINEKTNFNPSTPYAISRASADFHLKAIFKNFNFPVCFTRAANVYGPYQQLYRLIPKIIMCIKKKKKFFLHGGGLSRRSFVHIRDVSDGYFQVLLEGKAGETYHLSDNKFVTIRSVAEKICALMNVDFDKFIITNVPDRLGKDDSYLILNNKIKKELGWSTTMKLGEGILETIKWIETNFNVLKKLSLEYKHKK
jgi:dTDP-glucose 4,6-dehydratase